VTGLLVKSNELIDAGQKYRFFTPIFCHGSPTHLLMNSLSLSSIGPEIEKLYGQERMLTTYFIAGVAGNYASYLGSPSPSLGASGAIFGLVGAMGIFLWRHQRILGEQGQSALRSVGQTLMLNLVIGLAVPQIDNFGHLGGLLAGCAVGYAIGPRLQPTTPLRGDPYYADCPYITMPHLPSVSVPRMSIPRLPEIIAPRATLPVAA